MNEVEEPQSKERALNKILLLGIGIVLLVIVFTIIYIFKPPKSEDDVSFEETPEEEISLDTSSVKGDYVFVGDEEEESDYKAPNFTVNGDEEEGVEEEEESEDVTEEEEEEEYADLYIKDYSFSEDPKQNEEFTVYIEIGNKGDKTAKDFRWEWWANDDDRICDDEVDEIEPDDEETVECEYTYEDVDDYETKVVVDSDDDVEESDEDNNEETEDVTPEEEKKADLIIS